MTYEETFPEDVFLKVALRAAKDFGAGRLPELFSGFRVPLSIQSRWYNCTW